MGALPPNPRRGDSSPRTPQVWRSAQENKQEQKPFPGVFPAKAGIQSKPKGFLTFVFNPQAGRPWLLQQMPDWFSALRFPQVGPPSGLRPTHQHGSAPAGRHSNRSRDSNFDVGMSSGWGAPVLTGPHEVRPGVSRPVRNRCIKGGRGNRCSPGGGAGGAPPPKKKKKKRGGDLKKKNGPPQ